MAPEPDALTHYVRVRTRFQRAANLERDAGRQEALLGYLITPAVRRALGQVLGGLDARSRERAWALTGPYGTGKTAFAIFLADLLDPEQPSAKRAARRLLATVDPNFGGALRELRLHPVLVSGERAPLDVLLAEALDAALTRIWTSRRGARPASLDQVRRRIEKIARGKSVCVTQEVVRAYEESLRIVAEKTGAGLFLVLDEAGKALEYAAQHAERGDIFLLQALAELAGRTTDQRFLFLTVLHQAFEQYCARLGSVQRTEWAKVQGRFGSILFQERADQIVRLAGAALEPVRPRPAIAGWQSLVDDVTRDVVQNTGWKHSEVREALDRCWPLHPITAALMGPLFRGPLSQNERSLFAFLASGEPRAFQEFLASAEPPSLYTPDRLYDYVMASLGDRVFAHAGRAWASVETALRNLPTDAGEIDIRVLKTCGLLSMVGEQVGLRPSAATIARALGDEVGVRAALKRLVAASALIYRKFRDGYYLWEGSDLDLDALVRDAHAQLPADLSAAATLMKLLAPRPLVARRHLVQTGTLRYFEVRFVDAHQLEHGLEVPADEHADGSIVVVLPLSSEHVTKLTTALSDAFFLFTHCKSDLPVLVGVPSPQTYLVELARELAACEHVYSATAELQRDAVARRELASRIADVEAALEQEAAKLLDECEWFTQGGVKLSAESSQQLGRALSDVCDGAYAKAPTIRNELINRRVLSSAAAKARRNVLEAMVLRRNEHRLGFHGYPPEVSIYRSVFEATGLHRQVGDQWAFVPPERGAPLAGVWDEIDKFLEETEEYRRPVNVLYERLRRPPFGMKDGVLPLLAVAAFLTYESELALYERGSFVPQLTASVLERLLRSPEQFEVRRSRIAGARSELLDRLARSLVGGAKRDTATVLGLVRSILKFTASLPEYARRTATVSATAMKVRETLAAAREPAQLLFSDLPRACGFAPFHADALAEPETLEQFLAALRRNLSELQNAYAALLARVEQLLAQGFGIASSGTLRHELASRAERVLPLAVEPRLKTFALRAADKSLDHDDWIVSLATHLANKPPAEWHDSDEQQCEIELSVISRRFRTIEALALEKPGMVPDRSMLRVAIAQSGVPEEEHVLAVPSGAALQRLQAAFVETVERLAVHSDRAEVLAAMALAMRALLAEKESAETSAMGRVS
jgi:hypothetical protein